MENNIGRESTNISTQKPNAPMINMNTASNSCEGKSSWPELVGVSGEIAEKKVKEENASVKSTAFVPQGSFVTQEFRCDRVRIWVDQNGFVTKAPMIG